MMQPRELSIEELDSVAGGEFSWRGLAGAAAGAAVGGIGAGPGALGGGLLGGIGYCITSLF
jgi:hypothetical protein